MKDLEIIEAEQNIQISAIPDNDMDNFALHTLHAVERFFTLPGVQEDFEKWLKDYERRKAAV